jgi:hypothetical protein
METLKKDWKEVRYVGWESSMSPIIEREKKTMEYHVGWDKKREHGWFEIYDEESGGEAVYPLMVISFMTTTGYSA